jgi:hypothetical protein
MSAPTWKPAPPPAPHKVTGMRGRDKQADLRTVARLWLSDSYVRAGLGCVTTKALRALGMESPPMWDAKRWRRLERYVADLVQAVPAHLHSLMEDAA